MLEIRLTLMWKGDDTRIPISLSPPPLIASITFQNGRQTTAQAGLVGLRLTAALSNGESTSQATSSRVYTTEWERAVEDGSATLKWRLNLWCSAGSSDRKRRFIAYNTEDPVIGKWSGGHVPELPPGYAGGSLYGLDSTAPVAEWSVPASTMKSEQVCWKPAVTVRLSKLKAMGWAAQHLESRRRWHKRELLIRSDGLVRLTLAGSGNPILSWMVDHLEAEGSISCTTWIIIALLLALLAAAVAILWQLLQCNVSP